MKVTFRVDYTETEADNSGVKQDCPEATKILLVANLPSDSRHTALADVFERFLRAMGYNFKDGLYRGGE